MSQFFVSSESLPNFRLWDKIKDKRVPLSFDLEVTARCNNDCRHCYINLPVGDRKARARELSLEEITHIARDAVSLGAVWCLLTGGEPLLREDFFEIYLSLKRLGLLVSVFTNACLVTPEHVKLFQKYPPRSMEVTVYGMNPATYEAVTRRPGSFIAFRRGLDLLLGSRVKVQLKTMALRANVHELAEISRFCRAHTTDFFRFDPLLHLRFDGDPARNAEIRAQRLSPEEITAIEQADPERFTALKKGCRQLIALPGSLPGADDHLFHCGAGHGSFTVGYDGFFRLCSSLWHPDCIYDLRRGSLRDAWGRVPQVREMTSQNSEFREKCRACSLVNLCHWCPAHAHLETDRLDAWVEYFCQVAHARARALGYEEADKPGIFLDNKAIVA